MVIKDIELHVLINNITRHKVPIFREGWGLLINEVPNLHAIPFTTKCDNDTTMLARLNRRDFT